MMLLLHLNIYLPYSHYVITISHHVMVGGHSAQRVHAGAQSNPIKPILQFIFCTLFTLTWQFTVIN